MQYTVLDSAIQCAIVDSVSCRFTSVSVLRYSASCKFAMIVCYICKPQYTSQQVEIAECNMLYLIVHGGFASEHSAMQFAIVHLVGLQ